MDRSVSSGFKHFHKDIKVHHLTLVDVNIFYIHRFVL